MPKLESVHDMWNRLAKILEGSYDINEMYQRVLDSMENYPELEQLLNLLPQLSHTDMEDGGYKQFMSLDLKLIFGKILKTTYQIHSVKHR